MNGFQKKLFEYSFLTFSASRSRFQAFQLSTHRVGHGESESAVETVKFCRLEAKIQGQTFDFFFDPITGL